MRLGTGPRGTYVHAGRGGVYYRSTLGRKGGRRKSAAEAEPRQSRPGGSLPLPEIESGDAVAMVDASSVALLAEFNEKLRRRRRWPWVLVAGLLIATAGALIPQTVLFIAGVVACLAALPVAIHEGRNRTTVIFYNLEQPVFERLEALHAAFDRMRECGGVWHVEADAGAGKLRRCEGPHANLRRRAVSLDVLAPSFLRTNIPVPCFPVGRQKLYLLPDFVLVQDPGGVGAVRYQDLSVETEQVMFAEEGELPADARVLDPRPGNAEGPAADKANGRIPIVEYEALTLRSASGLHERLLFSRVGPAGEWCAAVRGLAEVLQEADSAVQRARRF